MEENIIQINESSEAELDLNTKVLEKGSDGYSSLTDTNNVSLFDKEFQDKVHKLQKDKRKESKELSEKVFVNKPKSTNETLDIKVRLFTASHVSTIKQDETEKSFSNTYIVIMLLAILIFAIFVSQYVRIKKRKRRINQEIELEKEREKYNDK